MGLGLKLFLAGLSGCLVTLAFLPFSGTDSTLEQVLMYGLCGGLFMAGVLLPYVKREDLFGWRSVGLILVSSVSFYAAVFTAIEWSSGKWGPILQDYVIASVIGAAIVMLAAPYLLALRYSVKFVGVSLIAALAGGVAFGAFVESIEYGMFLSFASWHLFMAIALHIAYPSEAQDQWLASVEKTRLRLAIGLFSLIVIVPLADDAIGASLQRSYAERDGGVNIYEQVAAYGFRDERRKPIFNTGCNYACADLVRNGIYSFQEYSVNDENGRYQAIFIGDNSDTNCWVFGEKSKAPISPTFQSATKIPDSRCMTYALTDDPIARFSVRDRIESVDAVFGIFSLRKTTYQVVRLDDKKIIADAAYYQYDSRFFGNTFGTIGEWDAFIIEALPPSKDTWDPPQ